MQNMAFMYARGNNKLWFLFGTKTQLKCIIDGGMGDKNSDKNAETIASRKTNVENSLFITTSITKRARLNQEHKTGRNGKRQNGWKKWGLHEHSQCKYFGSRFPIPSTTPEDSHGEFIWKRSTRRNKFYEPFFCWFGH